MSLFKRVLFLSFFTYLNWRPIMSFCNWLKQSFMNFWRSIMPNDPPDSPPFLRNEEENSSVIICIDEKEKCNSISQSENTTKDAICERITQNDSQKGGMNTSPSPESTYINVENDTIPTLDPYVDDEETDNYFCEYDSTWEDSSEETVGKSSQPEHISQIFGRAKSYKFNRFRNSARDMQRYRHDYPERTMNYYSIDQERTMNNYSSVQEMPNLQFYLGQRTSSPDGVSIDDFHNKWQGDYSKLERVHSYIQWLFPLQEPGMNYEAKELTKKEIEAFLQNDTAKQRLLKSYKLMLDFYGIKLSNDTTGDVETAENWRKRFENLDRNSHNNLRITRILKCLGTLGFPHYQAPLVKFFLEQTLVMGRLDSVKESALNYFIFAVLDKQERRELVKYAYQHYEPKHEFVWCPKTIQSMFEEEPFSGDDTTAIKQGNMYIAHGNIPMNKIRMAGEASDFMQLDQQSYSGGMTEVSIPQNNMPSQWGHDTGSRQGSKTKNGGDQNTRNDSATEHLLISQNSTSHSSYGALAISNSIATTDPTTKAPRSDQRKRTAVKREEGPSRKFSRGSEEDTHSNHEEQL
ncbi:opioid growth factor receptor-like protein 1 isoform X2 [Esox lucius]|uniref:Opioid growth factor receptor (OGFr) conserved domain-containing protein n=1 Tax=Esox lucius TaxID=8010 RepID=A0A6Q2Z9K0_ESOLU|nr:opioid growth factor receptor-like protein 1 isoform X2 [Esox lucius]